VRDFLQVGGLLLIQGYQSILTNPDDRTFSYDFAASRTLVAADPDTGDVHLVAGPHFRGVQFHAESILTQHGYELIHDLALELLETTRPASTGG
jgi:anthranilate/para-aminobenzoate synthase component II